MAVSKFRIYDYWKDKAITKKFEIKPVSACTKEDDALSIGNVNSKCEKNIKIYF